MARRSRQVIDRSKGGNFAALMIWLPVELKRALRKLARDRKATVTDVATKALAAAVLPDA